MTLNYKMVNTYILAGIDASGYDLNPQGDKEKLQFLFDTFMAEYGWRVKQAGLLVAVTDWLSGLPSACTIEWRNHLILKLGETWGLINATKAKTTTAQEDRFLENWFKFMAMRIVSLWKVNKIEGKASGIDAA